MLMTCWDGCKLPAVCHQLTTHIPPPCPPLPPRSCFPVAPSNFLPPFFLPLAARTNKGASWTQLSPTGGPNWHADAPHFLQLALSPCPTPCRPSLRSRALHNAQRASNIFEILALVGLALDAHAPCQAPRAPDFVSTSWEGVDWCFNLPAGR